MKFRKKPVVIEAIQWFKDGDHEQVESRSPEIIFDILGNYFYVSHFDRELPYPSFWLAVSESSEAATKNGVILPFAFYELKSGEKKQAKSDPELFNRYGAESKWKIIPKSFGYIKTLEGGHIVSPGDWIIKGIAGEFYPCKNEIFQKTYEPVKDEV